MSLLLRTSVSLRRGFIVSWFAIRMASSKFTYEDAIHRLNLLQSNKSTIQKIKDDLKSGKECTNLQNMENYLLRTGVTLSMLDKLSVIHVAGTKGKGSTSAMCESILRHHGFKTGFYSSPHLVAVRERIRLCGRVVTKTQFTQHFQEIYELLYKSQKHEGDMPMYFAFLTVLAFNMFLKEKVDVAVFEVGIGGIVDYTNVVRKVPVVGITTLGLDHTSILGNTLTRIAEAKAGIMKPGCEAYTVQQPSEAMAVLKRVASEVQCLLKVVPDFKNYMFPNTHKTFLPVNVEAYSTNASLAIQLAHAWMRINRKSNLNKIIANKISGKVRQNGTEVIQTHIIEEFKNTEEPEDILVTVVPNNTVIGLKECKWPGRYQIIDTDYAKFYLDGAHTTESVEICKQWFIDNSRSQNNILIFSATGDRDAEKLLTPLTSIQFSQIFFVTPSACKEVKQHNDNYYKNDVNILLEKCYKHEAIWKTISDNTNVTILESVVEVLESIKRNQTIRNKPSVLVTGSLHLVGAALSIIDPNLSD